MATTEERATSFGAIADDYDRLRPSPVPEAVDWLLPAGCEVAVDLAAGTGLFTRALAARVPTVIAVEPDERMRAVLMARTPGITAVEGRGEDMPIEDASADAVCVSSAWHWMDPARAVPEIARVLRPGGRFGVIWTSRDREVEWLTKLDGIHNPSTADPVVRNQTRHREVIVEGGMFGGIERASFGFSRRMSVADVLAMLGTYSGFITATPAEQAAVLDRARDVLDEHFPGADEIDMPIRSWCWRADRAR